jgi:hypothetical protein
MLSSPVHGWCAAEVESAVCHAVIWPIGDLRDHNIESGPHCWCSPTLDDGVLHHHSMDGREAFERGDRLVS